MPIQRDFLAIGLLYKEAAGAAVSSLIVELKKMFFQKKKVLCSSLTDKKKNPTVTAVILPSDNMPCAQYFLHLVW